MIYYEDFGTGRADHCIVVEDKPAQDPTEDLTWYDEEMKDSAESYAAFVNERLAKANELCSDPIVLVEQRLDYSRWVPQGFGTGDCVIVADDVLTVIDFKYGVGVLVEAERNPKMMCYALGAIDIFDGIYDINRVEMIIFQPRRENISSYTMAKEELLDWADTVLKPTAELAAKGEGEFKAGDHCGTSRKIDGELGEEIHYLKHTYPRLSASAIYRQLQDKAVYLQSRYPRQPYADSSTR